MNWILKTSFSTLLSSAELQKAFLFYVVGRLACNKVCVVVKNNNKQNKNETCKIPIVSNINLS